MFGKSCGLLMCCVAGPVLAPTAAAWADETVAMHQFRVEDQETEAREGSLDVQAVALTSDGSAVTVTVATSQDINTYLQDNLATGLATLLFDTDLDASTGGKSFSHDPVGIEREVEVYACIAYENGAEACAGGLDGAAIENTYAKYSPAQWSSASDSFEDVHEWPWDGGKGVLEGANATVSVPYADLGIKSGDEVRLYIFGSIFDELPEAPIRLTVK